MKTPLVHAEHSPPAWLLYHPESGLVMAALHAHSPAMAVKAAHEVYGVLENVPLQVARWTCGDRAYPEPINQLELIRDYGLAIGCAHCGYEIDNLFFDYRRERPLDPVFDDEAQEAFCGEDCLNAYDRQSELDLN